MTRIWYWSQGSGSGRILSTQRAESRKRAEHDQDEKGKAGLAMEHDDFVLHGENTTGEGPRLPESTPALPEGYADMINLNNPFVKEL